jgi:hypothetical protein
MGAQALQYVWSTGSSLNPSPKKRHYTDTCVENADTPSRAEGVTHKGGSSCRIIWQGIDAVND